MHKFIAIAAVALSLGYAAPVSDAQARVSVSAPRVAPVVRMSPAPRISPAPRPAPMPRVAPPATSRPVAPPPATNTIPSTPPWWFFMLPFLVAPDADHERERRER